MDRDWALDELEKFVDAAGHYQKSFDNRGRPAGGMTWQEWEDVVLGQWPIVKGVLRQVPGISAIVPVLDQVAIRGGTWEAHWRVAVQARTLLQRRDEIEDKLGTPAPRLRADRLHPWVWEAAKSLWNAGEHREAVGIAARTVNARLRQKLGRRDINDADAIRHAFSLREPEPGQPRLRVPLPEGASEPTYRSLQEGAMHFGAGCFQALRNPVSHEEGDLGEQEALEQLAAWSVLARWIDAAAVQQAEVEA